MSQPAGFKAYELTETELGALSADLDTINQLMDRLGIPEQTVQLSAADQVVRWWHGATPSQRPGREAMIKGLGVLLGCFLREVSAFRWRRVVDQYGESFSLVAQDDRVGPVVISPVNSIAKRFDKRPDGFVMEYFVGMTKVPQLRHFLNQDFLATLGAS